MFFRWAGRDCSGALEPKAYVGSSIYAGAFPPVRRPARLALITFEAGCYLLLRSEIGVTNRSRSNPKSAPADPLLDLAKSGSFKISTSAHLNRTGLRTCPSAARFAPLLIRCEARRSSYRGGQPIPFSQQFSDRLAAEVEAFWKSGRSELVGTYSRVSGRLVS